MMKTRLLIADDHKLMREGLKALIEKEADMEVVGEAEDGKSTVSLAHRTSPHVIVMDVSMPDLNGIEATRKILGANPNVRVIALSGHADQRFVREMLTAGASAYILKHTAFDELMRAIRVVMKGRKYLSPEVTRGVTDAFVELSKPLNGSSAAFVVLTDREREVLQLTAEGKSTKQAAGDLGVSIKTVETHRRNIMEKLQIHTVAELTKYAIREGLTSLDT
jgi:DNA-binding NarL/FixJ family response regulator